MRAARPQVVEGHGGLRRRRSRAAARPRPSTAPPRGAGRERRARAARRAPTIGHEVTGRERRERRHEGRPSAGRSSRGRPSRARSARAPRAGRRQRVRVPRAGRRPAREIGARPTTGRSARRTCSSSRRPELLPALDGADAPGQLLEHDPRVVGVAEERAVDAPRRAAHPGGRDRGEREAEADARRGRERRVDPEEAREGEGEERVRGEREQHEQHAEAAADEHVSGAALQEDRQLEHAVAHDRVRERRAGRRRAPGRRAPVSQSGTASRGPPRLEGGRRAGFPTAVPQAITWILRRVSGVAGRHALPSSDDEAERDGAGSPHASAEPRSLPAPSRAADRRGQAAARPSPMPDRPKTRPTPSSTHLSHGAPAVEGRADGEDARRASRTRLRAGRRAPSARPWRTIATARRARRSRSGSPGAAVRHRNSAATSQALRSSRR